MEGGGELYVCLRVPLCPLRWLPCHLSLRCEMSLVLRIGWRCWLLRFERAGLVSGVHIVSGRWSLFKQVLLVPCQPSRTCQLHPVLYLSRLPLRSPLLPRQTPAQQDGHSPCLSPRAVFLSRQRPWVAALATDTPTSQQRSSTQRSRPARATSRACWGLRAYIVRLPAD